MRRQRRQSRFFYPQGQPDPERRALAEFALDADRSPHGLGQALANGKPQSGTAEFPGDGLVSLREGFEQDVEFLLRDADAAVGYRHDEMTGIVLHGDEHLAALGEFQRIVDQVGEDLVEADRIGQNRKRHARRHTRGKIEVFRGGSFPEQAGDIVGDARRTDRNDLKLQFSGLDLRQVEDIVDDGEQAPARLDDDLGIALQALVESGSLEELGHDHQTVQRCADFMAHGGQEARLGGIGTLGLIARQAKFMGALLDGRFQSLAVFLQRRVTAADFLDHGVEAVDQEAGFAIGLGDGRTLITFGVADVLDGGGERQDGAGDPRLQAARHRETDGNGTQGHRQAGQQGIEQLAAQIGDIGDQHDLADALACFDDVGGHRVSAVAQGLENADIGFESGTLQNDGAAEGGKGLAVLVKHRGIGDFRQAADRAQHPQRFLGVVIDDVVGQRGSKDISRRLERALAVDEITGHIVKGGDGRHQAYRQNDGEADQCRYPLADAAAAHLDCRRSFKLFRCHVAGLNHD